MNDNTFDTGILQCDGSGFDKRIKVQGKEFVVDGGNRLPGTWRIQFGFGGTLVLEPVAVKRAQAQKKPRKRVKRDPDELAEARREVLYVSTPKEGGVPDSDFERVWNETE